jgi:hypothetical protein
MNPDLLLKARANPQSERYSVSERANASKERDEQSKTTKTIWQQMLEAESNE